MVLKTSNRSIALVSGLLGFFAASGFAQSPVFTNAAIVDGKFQTQVIVTPGEVYSVQTSANLVDWTSVATISVPTNLTTIVDPRGVAGFKQQYYRLQVGVVTSYRISFMEFADAGGFGFDFTPTPSFPVSLTSYSAALSVDSEVNFPDATEVFFTGPDGSGLNLAPANPNYSSTNNNSAFFQSDYVSSPAAAPGGDWVVQYKGTNHTFTVANPQASSHLVIPLPTANVVDGVLISVSWVYLDATTGATLTTPPDYMTNIQLQIQGAIRLYDSPNLPPSTTSNDLPVIVNWIEVTSLSLAYQDSLGNNYIISYTGPPFNGT